MYKDLKAYTQSQMFRKILAGVGAAIVALLIFQAGMHVGYRKAAFSYRFGDNYYRVFGDHGRKPLRGSHRGGFMESNGAIGKIVSIDLPTFVVASDNVEKVVSIGENTHIRHRDAAATPADLKVDDSVVVFGPLNEESQIEARLIRIVPAPAGAAASGAGTP